MYESPEHQSLCRARGKRRVEALEEFRVNKIVAGLLSQAATTVLTSTERKIKREGFVEAAGVAWDRTFELLKEYVNAEVKKIIEVPATSPGEQVFDGLGYPVFNGDGSPMKR